MLKSLMLMHVPLQVEVRVLTGHDCGLILKKNRRIETLKAKINDRGIAGQLSWLAILLCIASCSNSDSSYYPLHAGAVWQYDIERQTVIGITRQRDIIRNRGSETSKGNTTFVRTSINGIESHYAQSDNGIFLAYYLLPDETQLTPGVIAATVFQYPLRVGTIWQDSITTGTLKSYDPQAVDVIEAIPVSVSIESVNDTVRIAGEKYVNCLRIESIGKKLVQGGKYAYQTTMTIEVKNTRWYAPGVGLVKEQQIENTNILPYPGGSFTRTLKEFRPH